MTKSRDSTGRGNRFRAFRENMGASRLQFSKRLNMSEHTLKSYENGVREIPLIKAENMLSLFLFAGIDTSLDRLYYGKEAPSPQEREAIIEENDIIKKEIMFFKDTNLRSIIFKVPDSSMSPIFNRGDIVGGQKIRFSGQFNSVIGLNCIIQTLKGDQYLRKIIKCEGHKVTCCTININSQNNVSTVEEVDAYFVAHATRHWRLSELAQPITDLLPMLDRPLIPPLE